MRTCPECNASVKDGANFCDNCGYPMSGLQAGKSVPAEGAPVLNSQPAPASQPAPSGPPQSGDTMAGGELKQGICPACGSANLPGEMFCQNCGVQLPPVSTPPPELPRPGTVPPSGRPEIYGTGWLGDKDLPPLSEPVAPPQRSPAVESHPAGASLASVPAGKSNGVAPVEFVHAQFVIRETGRAVSLPAGRVEIVIGRSDPVKGVYPDIDLAGYGGDSSGVSRRHARLAYHEGRMTIEDLNSTNFTFLNKHKLVPGQRYPLRDGDELRLGLLVLDYLER